MLVRVLLMVLMVMVVTALILTVAMIKVILVEVVVVMVIEDEISISHRHTFSRILICSYLLLLKSRAQYYSVICQRQEKYILLLDFLHLVS